MLVLPLKPAVRFDLQTALAAWLDSSSNSPCYDNFAPSNPLQLVVPKPDFSAAACRDDLVRLQSLRNGVSDALLKPASHKSALEENGLADCQEYHAILLEFEKRGFPVLEDPDNGMLSSLTWKGAFAAQQERHGTLIWDRACILFNIVALETAQAADCSPTDRAACKTAVGHYQTAAGILRVLRELVESQDFSTVDLSSSMLLFWEKVVMAQAQNCIYRMASLATDAKHSTLSLLAQSAFELYKDALQAAQDPRLLSEVPAQAEDWGAYCKAVSMLSAAKAVYHQAVTHRLAHEHGAEIYRLAECASKLEALSKFCKTLDSAGVTSYTRRECAAILPVVKDRLLESETDNHNVYQETVPKRMPELAGKQLARAIVSLPENMMVPNKMLFVNI